MLVWVIVEMFRLCGLSNSKQTNSFFHELSLTKKTQSAKEVNFQLLYQRSVTFQILTLELTLVWQSVGRVATKCGSDCAIPVIATFVYGACILTLSLWYTFLIGRVHYTSFINSHIDECRAYSFTRMVI